jgi:hypothetical protein
MHGYADPHVVRFFRIFPVSFRRIGEHLFYPYACAVITVRGPGFNFDTHARTVNVDFIRIEYMVLAKYQHLSILELILLVKQHILILCKNLLWLLF